MWVIPLGSVSEGDANPPEEGLPLRGRKFEEGRVIEIMLRQCLA
jgi:hypothetical protein